ncbi:PucR family transcriptional regulator [Saccharopolyspora indica]
MATSRVCVGLAVNAGSRSAGAGRDHGRHRAGADLQPAPATSTAGVNPCAIPVGALRPTDEGGTTPCRLRHHPPGFLTPAAGRAPVLISGTAYLTSGARRAESALPHPATAEDEEAAVPDVSTDEQLRMSGLASDALSMFRVIAYFDGLGESAANADALVRSAALLAECPVGARWASGTVIRYGALGDLLDENFPSTPTSAEPAVWLERAAAEHPLDSLLLDRLQHALRVAAPRSAGGPRLGHPALLEVVLSDKERREDRVRAVGLLGLDTNREVRALALSTTSSKAALDLVARSCPGRLVHSVAVGNVTAVLLQDDSDDSELAEDLHAAIAAEHPVALSGTGGLRGPWVGIGGRMSVYAAPASWKQARRALRFASSTRYGRRAVSYGGLGSLELLAELPLKRLLNDPDAARINAIATSPGGAQEVATLEAYCVFGSLRRTAEEMHVHHSTVAARLAHLEAVMGWDLADPMDRFKATLVLMVRRVTLSSTELASSAVFGETF